MSDQYLQSFSIDYDGTRHFGRVSVYRQEILVDGNIVPCVLSAYLEPGESVFMGDCFDVKYKCTVNIITDDDCMPMDWCQIEALLEEPGFHVNFYQSLTGYVGKVEIEW